MTKKISTFAFAVLLLSATPCNADSTGSDPTPTGKPFTLTPIPKNPGRTHKMPGQPIYGEYANQYLFFFMENIESDVVTLSIYKNDIQTESVCISPSELTCGYNVSVSAPFSIELTIENGHTYVGIIE